MENCTMKSKSKAFSNGTEVEVVICMRVKRLDIKDQTAIFDFFDECSSEFFTVKIPAVAGEVI